MDYTEHTHCPNCFQASNKPVCTACFFNRDTYLKQEAASHHLPLFTRLNKGYILGRVLGEGSFAVVYAAIREKDQLPCAVKEYYPQDLAQRGLDGKTVNPKRNQEQLNTWQNRFIQEGELLRCCYDYPSVESGVVRYMAMVKQHNTAYLVMERLPGDNLSHYLAAYKTLSGEKICSWLKPLLETLQKLHAKEIYHRDISPNNIFLCSPNNPVLMDFGLAREGARDGVLKSSTLGAGTFIAPEQLTGGYCDQRTDLYALGAVIYLCLLGEVPPPVEARRQGAPLKRSAQPDKISLALQTVATHCLQLDIKFRPKNAEQILAELAPCWTPQSSSSTASFQTIIPDQAYPNPQVSQHQPKPIKSSAKFFKTAFKLVLWAGLAGAGFIAYQNYSEEQEKISKKERLLFAKARSLDDFKGYLEQCQICEAKQDATEKVAQFEHEQQAKLERQQKKKQEHSAYIKAQSIADLEAYINSCELCVDKKQAEAELAKLKAEEKTKAKDSPGSDLLEAITKPIVDSAVKALEDAKTQAEAEIKAKAEAEAKAQAEAEERVKAAELQAEIEVEAKAEAEARVKAEADAKAEAAAKRSTGADVREVPVLPDITNLK